MNNTKPPKNYLTPGGFRRLSDELHYLLKQERPRVVEEVSAAAAQGDRSENAEYIYGKRRLREIDRRIRFLTSRLDIAEVVDPLQQQKRNVVLFGATVSVEDENGDERDYHIVGVDEIDGAQGRISWRSPIGSALLGKKSGDTIAVRLPAGEIELSVLEIRYEAIPIPSFVPEKAPQLRG